MANSHSIVTNRTARYFVSGDTESAKSLWVVLHGYGQLASDFIESFDPAVTPERAFIAPEALSRFYLRAGQGKIGANWMTAEDRENEIADYVEYLDRVVEEVRSNENQKVYVLGFSQGSATACRWFAGSSNKLSAIIIWGGGLPPDLDRDAFVSQLGPTRLAFVYGDADEYVTSARLRLELQRLNDLLIPFDVTEYEGGHEIVEVELVGQLTKFEESVA